MGESYTLVVVLSFICPFIFCVWHQKKDNNLLLVGICHITFVYPIGKAISLLAWHLNSIWMINYIFKRALDYLELIRAT